MVVATWSLLLCFQISGAAAQPQAQPPPIQEATGPGVTRDLSGALKPGPPAQPEPLTPEKRGDIYMARKMYREAIEEYRRTEQDLAGLVAKKQREFADAQLEAKQKTAVILNKIGIAYHQLTDLDTAKKYYERSLKLNPKYAEAINNIGTIHYAKKSYRRAVGQYKKALKVNPNSASIYSNLGTAHFARKKYKDASEAYAKALELDPDVFEHRSTHGVLLQERNVEERAKFHYYLAKLYANAGMSDRALQYIRKSLEEGFKDRQKFVEEPEFASLQELPEFKELMTLQPRVL